MKKPEQKTSSNKMHGIGKVETHYLLMITGYDKKSKTYLVANKDARREAEKEIAFERRYFSRILSDTKKEWQADETTRYQRFPQLSSRSLRVRGTYRSASEAQAKMAKAQESDAEFQKKKNDPNKMHKTSNRNNKGNNRNKNQMTIGEKRTIGRTTEKKNVIRIGGSSDGSLGRVEGSDVAKWDSDEVIRVASERLSAKAKEYLAAQGPPDRVKPE